MNKLGIEAFKSEISIGDYISISALDYSYYGKVKSLKENSVAVDEQGLVFDIPYTHIWAYCKD